MGNDTNGNNRGHTRSHTPSETRPAPGTPEFVAAFQRALGELEAAKASGDERRIWRAAQALADASGGAIQASPSMRIE